MTDPGGWVQDAAIARFRRDPYLWATKCVTTGDAADWRQPHKLFPSYPYLKTLLDTFLTERVLLAEKSRKLLASWAGCAYASWLTIFNLSRTVFIASRKEQGSCELVERCQFILSHLPEWHPLIPKVRAYRASGGRTARLVIEDTDSTIEAVPEGSDQLRQFAASLVIADEVAHWEDFVSAWAAMRPSIESSDTSGGQLIMLTTPRADSPVREFVPRPQPWYERRYTEEHLLGTGMAFERSARGIGVISLHYSAHPHKRESSWRAREQVEYTRRQWQQEYELDWGIATGARVYEEFDAQVHVARGQKYSPAQPLVVGLDLSGLSPAAVMGQTDEYGGFSALGEILCEGVAAELFALKLKDYLVQRFPGARCLFYSDPAAWTRNAADGTTPAAIFQLGIGCAPRRALPDYASRHKSVNDRLLRRPGRGGLRIDKSACPLLFEALDYNYRYEAGVLERGDRIQPAKNRASHLADALQYALTGLDRFGIEGARMLSEDEEWEELERRRRQEEGREAWAEVLGAAGRNAVTGY